MSRASIHFEDAENGDILTRIDIDGPYNPASHAHRMMGQVHGFLEQHAVKRTSVTVPTQEEPVSDGG